MLNKSVSIAVTLLTLLLLIPMLGIPTNSKAATNTKFINSFPFEEEVEINGNTVLEYKLDAKPGQLIKAEYTTIDYSGNFGQKEGYEFTVDQISALSHYGVVEFALDGLYSENYPRARLSTLGSAKYTGRKTSKGNMLYTWLWQKYPAKNKILKYFVYNKSVDNLQQDIVTENPNDILVKLNNITFNSSGFAASTNTATLKANIKLTLEDYRDINIGDAGNYGISNYEINEGLHTGYLVNLKTNTESEHVLLEDTEDLYKVKTTRNKIYNINVTTEYPADKDKISVSVNDRVDDYSLDSFTLIERDKLNNQFKIKALKDYVYLSVSLANNNNQTDFIKYNIDISGEESIKFSFGFIKPLICKITFNYLPFCIVIDTGENISVDDLSKQITKPIISDNAKNLAKLLSKPDYQKLLESTEPNPEFYKNSYCKFKDGAYDESVPSLAQEVYDWSKNWSPITYPENYVECTAFVHMVYNMSGVSLKKYNLGHAINWSKRTDIFNVYESGKSIEIPKVGDIMIWSATPDNEYGHVGVVSDIINDSVFIANGNSFQPTHVFFIERKSKGHDFLNEKMAETNWKPKYILRIKGE